MTADTISPESLKGMVRFLAGDSLAGRKTGERGNSDAAAFIADQFKLSGLRPLPGDHDYYRWFDYASHVELGAGNALSVTSPSGTRALEAGRGFNPAGFSASGTVSGEILFVGYGITASSLGYDDYAGVDAHGKIVLVMRRSPDGANPHGEFGRHADLAAKVANAREHGAAGILFIDQPGDTGRLEPIRLDRNFSHADIPAAFTLLAPFDGLRDAAGRDLAAIQSRIDSTRKPASFLPAGWRATLTTDVNLHRARVPNVVGVLPGNDPKLRDELIVIGAHFDHLGWGGENSLYAGKDSAIHHGADDNASGTAAMVAIARKLAHDGKNRRSILFIGFNGEEEGLLGSASLVRDSTFPTSRIVTMINMDMIGRMDSNRLVVEGIGTSPVWDSLVPAVNAGRLTLKLGKQGFGPSDHATFYGRDIPVLFFFTGTHKDYHRPSDVWEKINYEGMARVAGLVIDMVRAIDARPERPRFTKVVETAQERSSTGFRVYVGTIPDYTYEEKGLRLSGVAAGGPAEKGGLREGDVIVRFATKDVNNIYDYTYILGELKPGQQVEVEFIRGGERKSTSVTVGSR